MMRKLRNAFVTVAAVLALAVVPTVLVGHASAQFDIGNCVAQGVNGDGSVGSGTCSGNATAGNSNGTNLTGIIQLVVNVLSIIVGVVAVIMIIFGGLKYITSGGDSGKITSAKNTIIYALIGLVVVAAAQFIVRFVLAKTAGVAQ